MAPELAFASTVTMPSPMSNALCIATTWGTRASGRARATIEVQAFGVDAANRT
jgi:hypothetical protein